MDNLHFIQNNILINFFKELTKYKNDYIYIYIYIILYILLYIFKYIHAVGSGFEYFYCYVNKLKPNRPNTINFVENGFKN